MTHDGDVSKKYAGIVEKNHMLSEHDDMLVLLYDTDMVLL
jgi:hypothetical protein